MFYVVGNKFLTESEAVKFAGDFINSHTFPSRVAITGPDGYECSIETRSCMGRVLGTWTTDGLVESEDAVTIKAECSAHNYESLWAAGTRYQETWISGSATSMLTLGVLAHKPKSLACSAWIQSIWALYYQRKPLVDHDMPASFLDFSSIGPMPYSVPELMAEIMS